MCGKHQNPLPLLNHAGGKLGVEALTLIVRTPDLKLADTSHGMVRLESIAY